MITISAIFIDSVGEKSGVFLEINVLAILSA
jgi:hypothetical protein